MSDDDWVEHFGSKSKVRTKDIVVQWCWSIAEVLLVSLILGVAMAIIAESFIPPVVTWVP